MRDYINHVYKTFHFWLTINQEYKKLFLLPKILKRNHHKERWLKSWHAVKYLSNYELIPHNLVLIYGTRMCFSKFWPFYLRHQHIWLASGICTMKDEHRHLVLCIWSWSTLLGLNKIPFLLYKQLFIYTTISLSSKSSDRKCLVNIRAILKRYF